MKWLPEADIRLLVLHKRVFSHNRAREIWDFVQGHAPHVQGLMVHCHAGIQRSATVAKAVAEQCGLTFPPAYDIYNKLVYRKPRETAR
jgi:predicted protein tyrosine phosphatase